MVPLYLIILVVSTPQLSDTIYVMSLPDMADSFRVNNNLAEFTLTVYLIGFGVFLWAAISDKFGSKPIFLLGFFIYLISCLGYYYSISIEQLFSFHFIQAFGTSVGSVLGQAIVRDFIKPDDRRRVFLVISMIMTFAPAIDSIIGYYTIKYYDWNFIFIGLFIIAVITIFLLSTKLPETLVKSEKKQTVIYYIIITIMTALMSYMHNGTLNQLLLFIFVQANSMQFIFYFVLNKEKRYVNP